MMKLGSRHRWRGGSSSILFGQAIAFDAGLGSSLARLYRHFGDRQPMTSDPFSKAVYLRHGSIVGVGTIAIQRALLAREV